MNTTDEFGNPIYVLPDCAFCVLKGAFLDTFEDCPSCQFDRFGDRCIPALCDYYTEDYALYRRLCVLAKEPVKKEGK